MPWRRLSFSSLIWIPVNKKQAPERGLFFSYRRLQKNAKKTVCAFVDDAFQCCAEIGAGIRGHMVKFGVQSFADELMKRFAKEIGFPKLCGVAFEFS